MHYSRLLQLFATLKEKEVKYEFNKNYQEIASIYVVGRVNLPDLLLLFIYTEVLGMIGVFYVSNKIPITLPLFIAMTALSRLIILQGKDMEPSTLIYEAGAILLIAIACLIIRYRPPNQSTEL